MAVLEFSWEKSGLRQVSAARRPAGIRLSDDVLLRNALWFVKLRWAVAVFLVCVQVTAALFGPGLAHIGIALQGLWPIVIAAVLATANVWYILTIKKSDGRGFSPAVNIWTQIVVDLICVTVVVHFLGSIVTPAPFLFMLHIVLAGVFLSTETSFVVLFIAWLFYGVCVALEYSGIVEPASVLVAISQTRVTLTGWTILFQEASVDLLFLLVWYMVAQLSTVIRIRENQLIEAEAQTRKAQSEKDRYAVQMTHQLKAPLDAIRSNIALLVKGYCGGISEEMSQMLQKIDFRTVGMSRLILDVLKLSRVNSMEDAPTPSLVDLSTILKENIDELRPQAARRSITIETDLSTIECRCIVQQIQMLFDNIVANAISYSYDGGTVEIRCHSNDVVVSDNGIGIPEDKLPHIFDEYFRTKEASEFNRASSGIGLAIVKRVAQNHGLRLMVESEPKKGTTFTVHFPATEPEAHSARLEKALCI
jgi:signal transduction histidine kinase